MRKIRIFIAGLAAMAAAATIGGNLGSMDAAVIGQE